MINSKIDQKKRKMLSQVIDPIFFNPKKVFFTTLFVLYLGLSFAYYIWAIRLIILIPSIIGVFVFLLLSTRIRREDVPRYLLFGLLFLFFIISSLAVGRTGDRFWVPIVYLVSNPGIALMLIRRQVYSWGGSLSFYSMVSYFIFKMLSGVEGKSALTLTSYNGISILMLVACISFYIIRFLENKELDIKPAIITFFISVWGIGRSGILASFMLLIGLLYVKSRSKRRFFFILLLCLILIFIFIDGIREFFINHSFFSDTIEISMNRIEAKESSRLILWRNYWENLDLYRLIFGVNVLEDPWLDGEMNMYNYHNSFIHLHLQTGLMGLVVFGIIFFIFINYYKTNKMFFFLLLAFVFRSSTDLFIFFSRFDFLLFFFMFYYIKGNRIYSYKSGSFPKGKKNVS